MMLSARCSDKNMQQRGFSLIEMLVTMLIAMVILGGLLLTFTQQNSEYKYQNRRVDAVQDLEFAINFIADDLRSVLAFDTDADPGTPPVPDIAITNTGADPNKYSSQVDIRVWEEDEQFWGPTSETVAVRTARRNGAFYQAIRRYDYDKGNESLRYDRNTVPNVGVSEVLPNVTDFRVFQDTPDAQPILNGATPFPGSPLGLQDLTILDSGGGNVTAPGYTVLIEVAVDAGYKQGSFINARGVDVRTFDPKNRKRVWRYIQVHPLSAAN